MKQNRYRLYVVVFCTTWCCLLGTTCLRAQEDQAANGDSEQLCGVVRVSWRLIEAIAEEQVSTKIQFESPFILGSVVGDVESQVDMTIQRIQTKSLAIDENAVFRVKAKGTANGSFVAIAGPLGITGPISVVFDAEQAVWFDGRSFAVSEARVTATVTTSVSTVSGRRNGPLGRAVAYIAWPIVEREVANTERRASRVASQRIAEYVNRYTTELVARLNEVTPIEESLFRLYPEMAEWRIRIVADDNYLDARYAPPGSQQILLPQSPYQNAGVEVWIRTTPAEAKFLERVGNWKQLQHLMAEYLPNEGSESRKLTSGITVRSFGPWFALLIGRLPSDALTKAESASASSSFPSP